MFHKLDTFCWILESEEGFLCERYIAHTFCSILKEGFLSIFPPHFDRGSLTWAVNTFIFGFKYFEALWNTLKYSTHWQGFTHLCCQHSPQHFERMSLNSKTLKLLWCILQTLARCMKTFHNTLHSRIKVRETIQVSDVGGRRRRWRKSNGGDTVRMRWQGNHCGTLTRLPTWQD